jgi:hypothetical protein
MATNPPEGPGRRGSVKKRDQVFNPKNKKWTKRGEDKKFIDQKSNNKPFKGIRKK